MVTTTATFDTIQSFDPRALERLDDTQRARLEAAIPRLRTLARLLDEAFTIPFLKIKVGIDPLLGLVPVVGDWIAGGMSLYIVAEAWRLGVPRMLLARMVGNVLLDAIVGVVPVLGDLFDIGFKANKRNIRLLLEHFEAPPTDLH